MAEPAITVRGVVPATQLPRWYAEAAAPSWSQAHLAGRFVELSGGAAPATLTMATALLLDAQRLGEPTAWISSVAHHFYPPDLAANGIDLDALAVVRAPAVSDVPRAAERLLRSGAFGLVICDLWTLPLQAGRDLPAADGAIAMQSRLVGLAQKHDAVVCCLTPTPPSRPSLGSLVSRRGVAVRERTGPARYRCTLQTIKDKRHAPGWHQTAEYRAPAGLS
jgi:recombination protein RecA